jgi:hypothetical protein
MSPESKRRKSQAVVLFLVAPVGALGFIVQFTDGPMYPGAPLVFALATIGAVALGNWLWRKKDDDEPEEPIVIHDWKEPPDFFP